MKKNNFLRIGVPMLSFIVLALIGCEEKKSREQAIVGEWKAHWETYIVEDMPEIPIENLTMNGIITFKANGKADISAFGYQGCIFSDDTLKSTINWKMDNTVLRFIDSDDDHGLPYTIKMFSSNQMKLTLLEDINLTLDKIN